MTIIYCELVTSYISTLTSAVDKYTVESVSIRVSIAHLTEQCLAAPQRVTGRARTPVH